MSPERPQPPIMTKSPFDQGWCAPMRAGIFPACPQLRVPRCRERLTVKSQVRQDLVFFPTAPLPTNTALQARSGKDAEGALPLDAAPHNARHPTPKVRQVPRPRNRGR